jgi:hypothetical protein
VGRFCASAIGLGRKHPHGLDPDYLKGISSPEVAHLGPSFGDALK